MSLKEIGDSLKEIGDSLKEIGDSLKEIGDLPYPYFTGGTQLKK